MVKSHLKSKVTKTVNDNLSLAIDNEGARQRDISQANNAYYYRQNRLPYEELNAIYQQAPIARRAVDLICKHFLKNGFAIDIPDREELVEEVMKRWKEYKLDELLLKVTKDALISGHSILLIKDRFSDAGKPLNLKSLKDRNLDFIYVDARYITTVPCLDPFSVDFYKPIQYAIAGTTVDKSYVVEFSALDVPNYLKPNYKYMGMSIYEPAFKTLISDDLISKAIPNIVWRSSIVNYKITGFKEALKQGKEMQILKYISTTENSKSILNATVCDAEDTAEVLTRELAGLDGLDQRSIYRLSAAFGIPAVILLGKSPDGQNSTGRADFEAFYNFIEEWQEQWKPSIERIIKVLIANITGEDDVSFEFEYNKVNMETPQQKADNDGKILENVSKMEQLSLPVSAMTRYLADNGIINEDEQTEISELDAAGENTLGNPQDLDNDPYADTPDTENVVEEKQEIKTEEKPKTLKDRVFALLKR